MADDLSAYDLQQKLKAAIEGVLQDTAYVPSHPAFLVDCVVLMGWSDGQGGWGTSHIRCGSPWSTDGLIQGAIRVIANEDHDDGDLDYEDLDYED